MRYKVGSTDLRRKTKGLPVYLHDITLVFLRPNIESCNTVVQVSFSFVVTAFGNKD